MGISDFVKSGKYSEVTGRAGVRSARTTPRERDDWHGSFQTFDFILFLERGLKVFHEFQIIIESSNAGQGHFSVLISIVKYLVLYLRMNSNCSYFCSTHYKQSYLDENPSK